jgi:hypothetical protein
VSLPRFAFALVLVSVGAGCGGTVVGGDGGTPEGGSDGSVGKACGKDAGRCADDAFCDYPDDVCGRTGRPGTCKPRPMACDLLYAPVCTCAGMIAGNACGGQAGGSDVDQEGNCMELGGYVRCGEIYCDAQSAYCILTTNDVPGSKYERSCQPIPTQCGGKATCACLGDRSPCKCTDTADGVRLECPGG